MILNQIEYKLEYDVVKNCQLFRALLLCLCNSIGGCIFKTDHQETPVMIRTNKNLSRPTTSWISSSFSVHLFICQILQLRTRRTLVSYFSSSSTSSFRSSSLSGSLSIHSTHFLQSLELERSMLVAFLSDTSITLYDGNMHELFLCSTETQTSSPLS